MASSGILQTPTRRSAEALGRSNVVLIINARKLRWQILALGRALKCRAPSQMARKSAARVLVSQLWSLPQEYSRDIDRPFTGRSGVKHPKGYMNKNNFSVDNMPKKRGQAYARSTWDKLSTIGGSI
jgi:hypothetical protein